MESKWRLNRFLIGVTWGDDSYALFAELLGSPGEYLSSNYGLSPTGHAVYALNVYPYGYEYAYDLADVPGHPHFPYGHGAIVEPDH